MLAQTARGPTPRPRAAARCSGPWRISAVPGGQDIWIAVKLPGEFEGDNDLEDGTAARRWTTVVLHPDELSWLREALALSAEGGDPDDDDDD